MGSNPLVRCVPVCFLFMITIFLIVSFFMTWFTFTARLTLVDGNGMVVSTDYIKGEFQLKLFFYSYATSETSEYIYSNVTCTYSDHSTTTSEEMRSSSVGSENILFNSLDSSSSYDIYHYGTSDEVTSSRDNYETCLYKKGRAYRISDHAVDYPNWIYKCNIALVILTFGAILLFKEDDRRVDLFLFIKTLYCIGAIILVFYGIINFSTEFPKFVVPTTAHIQPLSKVLNAGWWLSLSSGILFILTLLMYIRSMLTKSNS